MYKLLSFYCFAVVGVNIVKQFTAQNVVNVIYVYIFIHSNAMHTFSVHFCLRNYVHA